MRMYGTFVFRYKQHHIFRFRSDSFPGNCGYSTLNSDFPAMGVSELQRLFEGSDSPLDLVADVFIDRLLEKEPQQRMFVFSEYVNRDGYSPFAHLFQNQFVRSSYPVVQNGGALSPRITDTNMIALGYLSPFRVWHRKAKLRVLGGAYIDVMKRKKSIPRPQLPSDSLKLSDFKIDRL